MTDTEIKRIQEVLGNEFEVKRMNESVVVVIDKVDIWEGIDRYIEWAKLQPLDK